MSSSSTKFCFNSNCKDVSEGSRRGWRRRTGEFADLCDRCATAYDSGKFCETFHMNASGWRCCESCGKQIHCGCIVSFHMFVLLDAGGIECITCARKSFILTPNPAWPPPSLFLPAVPEKAKDLPVKSWSSIAGSGPVPWRQAPSLFNASNPRPESHSRIPFEAEMPGAMNERHSALPLDKLRKDDSSERPTNGVLKVDVSQQPSFIKNESLVNHISFLSKSETNDQRSTTPSLAIVKKIANHHAIHSSADAHFLNVRPRGDLRGRNHLLPRYLPKMTDQELQQISGDSNSVITPLFEKMLSASDAGRIGRLVLPKKCAEAYFPPICQPEGLPLVVQDMKGKEWVFQFRYWPNNNSRMYVLEGVTPCIQSMQLQAGDIVTFSRLEPEGKLVMGFRKSSTVNVDQGNVAIMGGNEVSSNGVKPGENIFANRLANLNSLATSCLPIKILDPYNLTAWSEVDKSGYIAKEGHVPQPVFRKRKSNNNYTPNNNSTDKRLKIENEMIELKLTWEQAQGLLRPPPNYIPSVVMVEGFEFEEYEQYAPIIGPPTILATDHSGKKIQWAQCEDCLKWRKVPGDVLFPSRWTCSDNMWDPERSTCSAAQELTTAQLVDLLPKNDDAICTKMKVTKEEPDSLEALEGLDTLANLAIQEEGDSPFTSSSQVTTRHPRHRPGCTCIVCIQPPSGKGHKHRQSCNCNVCLTMKRRFRTLSLRRELKQSEKDSENSPSLTDNMTKLSDSPFKGQIDLNSQPEREEELSDSGGIMRFIAESKQHKFPNCSNSNNNQGNVDLDRPITCSSSVDAIASLTAPER